MSGACGHDQVAPKYLAAHVDRLLKALLVCFFDESWPVRDAACVASGRFAGAYPEECRPSLEKLYERFVVLLVLVGLVVLTSWDAQVRDYPRLPSSVQPNYVPFSGGGMDAFHGPNIVLDVQ